MVVAEAGMQVTPSIEVLERPYKLPFIADESEEIKEFLTREDNPIAYIQSLNGYAYYFITLAYLARKEGEPLKVRVSPFESIDEHVEEASRQGLPLIVCREKQEDGEVSELVSVQFIKYPDQFSSSTTNGPM